MVAVRPGSRTPHDEHVWSVTLNRIPLMAPAGSFDGARRAVLDWRRPDTGRTVHPGSPDRKSACRTPPAAPSSFVQVFGGTRRVQKETPSEQVPR